MYSNWLDILHTLLDLSSKTTTKDSYDNPHLTDEKMCSEKKVAPYQTSANAWGVWCSLHSTRAVIPEKKPLHMK